MTVTKRDYIKFLHRYHMFVETVITLMRHRDGTNDVWLPEMEEFAEGLVVKPITEFSDEDMERVLTVLSDELDDGKIDIEFVSARRWFISLFPSEEAALQHAKNCAYPVRASDWE